MPSYEIALVVIVAILLVIAVIAARSCRVSGVTPQVKPTAVMPPRHLPIPTIPRPPAPPDGSVMGAQLECGQTIHVQTKTARYSLTLRNPDDSLYDAVRICQASDGRMIKKRFRMFFYGSLVPGRTLMRGWFVVGGRLSYYTCLENGAFFGPTTSMTVQRVIFSVPLKQAS